MKIFINNKIATHDEIRSLPLAIKSDIALLLKQKFRYKIKDIMIIFGRTRDAINKWLSKNKLLYNAKVIRLSGISSRNKSFIKITVEGELYTINYFAESNPESDSRIKKNSLISGDTILSLTDSNFSKSTIGRLRKEVFTQELYDSYNTKIIKHVNRYLLEYKPVILKSFNDKSFIWHENQLAKIINLLEKEEFSIKAIKHIFSNIYVNIKFTTPIELKQEAQIAFIAYIWCSMTTSRKKEIIAEITKVIDNMREYTTKHIDLYSILDEFFQSPYVVDEKIKKLLHNVIDSKTYIDASISEIFNKKNFEDNKDDFLSKTIYEFSYTTTKKSILNLFVSIVKSLYNILRFHLEFNEEKANHKTMALSESKIKKYLSNPKEIKKFNIYYSNKDNCFKFKNKHDLDFHFSTTYTMTR